MEAKDSVSLIHPYRDTYVPGRVHSKERVYERGARGLYTYSVGRYS